MEGAVLAPQRRHWSIATLLIVSDGVAALMLAADLLVVCGSVIARFVFDAPVEWSDDVARGLMVGSSFFGAASALARRENLGVAFFVSLLPARLQRAIALFVEGLMALIALFMINWGIKLVAATWQNSIADFPSLSVGVTYLPIPIGGAILLLFVFERLAIGPLPLPARPERAAAAFD